MSLCMEAPDGKQRITDCANTKGLFRIIQSIPSPKAEQAGLDPIRPCFTKTAYDMTTIL